MADQSRRVRCAQTDDGGIVMDIDNGKMFSLNASGSVFFELLAAGSDESAIVAEVSRRFGIAPEIAARDLNEFRRALQQLALLPETPRACGR